MPLSRNNLVDVLPRLLTAMLFLHSCEIHNFKGDIALTTLVAVCHQLSLLDVFAAINHQIGQQIDLFSPVHASGPKADYPRPVTAHRGANKVQ